MPEFLFITMIHASPFVLIVDDDTFSHKLLFAMQRELAVTDVHTAINGRVGLAVAQKMAVADGLIMLGAHTKPMPIAIQADALARNCAMLTKP